MIPKATSTTQYRSEKARMIFLSVNESIAKYGRCENPMCRKQVPWNQLDIHHIIPIRLSPELMYDVRNMLALCKDCHHKIEQNYQTSETKRNMVTECHFCHKLIDKKDGHNARVENLWFHFDCFHQRFKELK